MLYSKHKTNRSVQQNQPSLITETEKTNESQSATRRQKETKTRAATKSPQVTCTCCDGAEEGRKGGREREGL